MRLWTDRARAWSAESRLYHEQQRDRRVPRCPGMGPFSRGGYGNDHRIPPGQFSFSSLAGEEGVSFAAGRNHDCTESGSDGPNGDRQRQMEAGRRSTGTVSTRGRRTGSAHRVGRTRSAGRAEKFVLPEQMNAPHGKGSAVSGMPQCRHTLASDSVRYCAIANQRSCGSHRWVASEFDQPPTSRKMVTKKRLSGASRPSPTKKRTGTGSFGHTPRIRYEPSIKR